MAAYVESESACDDGGTDLDVEDLETVDDALFIDDGDDDEDGNQGRQTLDKERDEKEEEAMQAMGARYT